MSTTRLTTLIRLSCDGELTPDQAAELNRLKEDVQSKDDIERQVAFEESLRERVGDVLKSSCSEAPAELANRVRAAFSEEADVPANEHRSVIARIFAQPHRFNYYAAAACVALIAGTVLFGIFGRPIDRFRVVEPVDFISRTAQFVSEEHTKCATDESLREQKFTWQNSDEARNKLESVLNAPVEVFDLSDAGYRFAGAGRCALPTNAESCHLLYRKADASGAMKPCVSIFVVNYGDGTQRLCDKLASKTWNAIDSDKNCLHKVLSCTDGRVVYLLVCCDERDLESITKSAQFASRRRYK